MEDWDRFILEAAGDVRDPYPDYATARRGTPVLLGEHMGMSVYTAYRYDDVAAILKDPETYSSRVYASMIGLVLGPSILQMDGAEHRAHRALVAGVFRRSVLAAWEPTLIEPTVHELIDGFIARGSAELVREFTFQYPIQIISKILGIPSGDEETFARLSIELIGIQADIARGLAASQTLHEYFAEILTERRARPREDLISTLATATIDGVLLTDEEIFGFLRLLLPAGAETTYRLLGSLLFALLTTGGIDAVRANRALLPAAIEETLRWESPVQFVSREATRDLTLGGIDIPAGAHVGCSIGSANRDETVFDQAAVFDLARTGPSHVAFADGPHRCLGEHLARLEVTVAMNALLDRLADIRLEPGDTDPHIHGHAFRSPTALPITFAPEDGSSLKPS